MADRSLTEFGVGSHSMLDVRWTISELPTKVQNQNLKIENSKSSHGHQFCNYCIWRTIVNHHIKINNAITKVMKPIERNPTMQKSFDLKIYILSCVQMKLCDNQIQRTCDNLRCTTLYRCAKLVDLFHVAI